MHDGGHTIPDSWFKVVLDWFEGPGPVSPAVGGGTARFEAVGSGAPGRFEAAGERGSRFRSAGEGGSRFKQPKN